MKKINFLQSNCRHCRYYQPEGRRGGSCQKLGVSVDATWSACILASSPFTPAFSQLDNTLKTLDKTLTNLEEIVHLETAFSLPSKTPVKNQSQNPCQQKSNVLAEKRTVS